MLSKSSFKFILLMGLAIALSATTVVFGAAPMRIVRRSHGRAAFWLGHMVVVGAFAATGLVSYAAVFAALAVLVGVYSEAEDHGSSAFHSAAVAILATIGASALAVGTWLFQTKANFLGEVKAQIVPLVEQMSAVNQGIQLNVDTVIQQLPSGILIVLMGSLAIALMWERRLLRWFQQPQQAGGWTTERLSAFRVPDLTVWLVMVAILGAFLQHGNRWLETVSINAINVFVVIYFFQGLAVVSEAFQAFKVSPFWQGIWYVIIVLQLFLLVSFLGFIDYWLDFRERLSRKPAETNKSF